MTAKWTPFDFIITYYLNTSLNKISELRVALWEATQRVAVCRIQTSLKGLRDKSDELEFLAIQNLELLESLMARSRLGDLLSSLKHLKCHWGKISISH